jgi:hypothetical protein
MKPQPVSNRRSWRIALAAVLLGGVLVVAGGAAGYAADPPPADCGYSGCHNGAPIPGSEVTPTPVPATLSKPLAPARPKIGRNVAVDGSLLPAHEETVTVQVTFQRLVGTRYSTWRTVVAYIPPGPTRYRVAVRLPRKGTWRVRASHQDALHLKSYSAYRVFRVR